MCLPDGVGGFVETILSGRFDGMWFCWLDSYEGSDMSLGSRFFRREVLVNAA